MSREIKVDEEPKIRLKGKSKEIYDWFKKKYGFGELGLFEAIVVCSVYVKNTRYAVNTIIIAPSGEAKSDILDDIEKFFPKKLIIKKGIVTEYWIAKHIPQEALDMHTLGIGDLADSLTAMQTRRIAGFLSFLKNVIDGKAEILTAHDTISYNVKKCAILVNIPKQAMNSATGNLITTTFFDRTIPFQFATKWEEWSHLYLKNKLKNSPVKKVSRMKMRTVDIPKKFEKSIVEEAKFLMQLKFSGLPRNIQIVKAVLCGNAYLNGRNKVTKDDFNVWDLLKPFFSW